jgi:hypothetical protein
MRLPLSRPYGSSETIIRRRSAVGRYFFAFGVRIKALLTLEDDKWTMTTSIQEEM